MNRNSDSSLLSIIGLIIAFIIISNVIGIIIPIIVGFIVFAVILFLVLSIIKGDSNNKSSTSNVKVNDNGLIDILRTIDDNKIQINSDTYLYLSDLDNITLDTIDVYFNSECIGSLNDFGKYQPKEFNDLCKSLIKKLNKQSKSNKLKDKITESISVEKDCAYFIKKLSNINNQIETEEINELVNKSVDHLKDIKRIEDEFGIKKDKTRKLYEYYLPMYLDILVNYDRLHDSQPLSDDFKNSQDKVLKTGSMINNALSNLSESLLDSYQTNLNVDMKTLESILKKDGLIDETKVG